MIKFKKDYEIDLYKKWKFEQKKIKKSDYNLFITTGAGTLYPPDILNIEERYLNLASLK